MGLKGVRRQIVDVLGQMHGGENVGLPVSQLDTLDGFIGRRRAAFAIENLGRRCFPNRQNLRDVALYSRVQR